MRSTARKLPAFTDPPPLPHGLTIGWRIREERQRLAMTQAQLAERINQRVPAAAITAQAVAHWEAGRAYPPIRLVRALASELDLAIGALIP